MDYYNYHRRKSSIVQIGNTPLGGEYPVRIQSMTNTSTLDTAASVDQCIRIIQAGADYVRLTAQGVREAENLGEIKRELIARGYTTPLVADIHFNPKAADAAAYTVDKVRINPGNFVDSARTFKQLSYTDEEYTAELQKLKERFIPFLNICKEQHTAIRLGVNHGSLSDRIMSRYGDTPEGMVESCMEFLRICRSENFDNVVISIKASNTVVMVRTVRLLIETMESEGMNYPLHLGVTEAGDGEDGRIKSAVGIGTLLADGIGDTIRVSLSEAPEAEIPVACKLVNYITARTGHKPITAPDIPLEQMAARERELQLYRRQPTARSYRRRRATNRDTRRFLLHTRPSSRRRYPFYRRFCTLPRGKRHLSVISNARIICIEIDSGDCPLPTSRYSRPVGRTYRRAVAGIGNSSYSLRAAYQPGRRPAGGIGTAYRGKLQTPGRVHGRIRRKRERRPASESRGRFRAVPAR